MAKAPGAWQHRVQRLCVGIGLCDWGAEECVSETLLRYYRQLQWKRANGLPDWF